MQKLLTIIAALVAITITAFAEFTAPDFSSPEGQKYLETVKKADKWAIEYFKDTLNSLAPLGITEANGMSVMLAGAVVTAQENLEEVARHLTSDHPDSQAQFVEEATSSLKFLAEDLEGIFFAYPNSKQAFKKAKEYLNEETDRNASF